jgi:toxin ParE1/3/4
MPSSRKLRLSLEARADFRDVLQFTQETWGQGQRDAYKDLILQALQHLAQFPDLGHRRNEIDPDLRRYPVGQHLIFYTVTDDELRVARILHNRQDANSELFSGWS